MPTLLTGIQPTGSLHIGNYLGAIKPLVELQKDYEVYLMIADLHALTIEQDPLKFSDQVIDLTATLIASGIDTNKTTIFLQSLVPVHSELAWIFSTMTPLGELERMTQYKEKSDKHGQNVGLLTYPVLMAADVLLYQPDIVPVGDDQTQHLELTRIIARKFNKRFGITFKEPRIHLTSASRIMALNDPTKKMSKSIAGSAIGLDAQPEEIQKIVMGAVTDTTPGTEISPGVANLFRLLGEFAPDKLEGFETAHKDGTLKYVELKNTLADAIADTLVPIQAEKKLALQDKDKIIQMLQAGSRKALTVAQGTMHTVRNKLGLIEP